MSWPLPRLRVGVDFHTYDGKFQGVRSHLVGIYSEAIERAPDIDFVFFVGEPQHLAQAHRAFTLPNVRLVRNASRSGPWRLGVQLPWLHRREELDVLHTQFRLPLGWPWLGKARYACTIHDVLFETHPELFPMRFRWLMRRMCRHAVRESVLLFTVSRYSQMEIARLYGVDPARVTVTGNGVDRTRFRPGDEGRALVEARGLVPGEYLCTVGRVEPRKNHRTLLRAFARLPGPRPKLLVIGRQDREFGVVAADAEARRLGIRDDVVFLDEVDDDDLPALLRHARLFVYPSLAEGFGLPVIEAMASGLPVITSKVTALPEVVGSAALVIDPRDTTELTAAMTSLLTDPQRRRRLVQQGLARSEAFDWSESAERLIGAYRGLDRTAG